MVSIAVSGRTALGTQRPNKMKQPGTSCRFLLNGRRTRSAIVPIWKFVANRGTGTKHKRVYFSLVWVRLLPRRAEILGMSMYHELTTQDTRISYSFAVQRRITL